VQYDCVLIERRERCGQRDSWREDGVKMPSAWAMDSSCVGSHRLSAIPLSMAAGFPGEFPTRV
jgi:hypothetical protein